MTDEFVGMESIEYLLPSPEVYDALELTPEIWAGLVAYWHKRIAKMHSMSRDNSPSLGGQDVEDSSPMLGGNRRVQHG